MRWILLTLLSFAAATPVHANWAAVEGLPEADIRFIKIVAASQETWWAGGRGGLYVSQNAGASWKMSLKLRDFRGGINDLAIQSSGQKLWAATDEGIYASDDAGKKWKRIFRRADEHEENALSLAVHPANVDEIYVGTKRGLFVSQDGGGRWIPAPGLNDEIRQILILRNGSVVAVNGHALWWRTDSLAWERRGMFSLSSAQEDDVETSDSGIETEDDLHLSLFASSAVELDSDHLLWAKEGWLYEVREEGRKVDALPQGSFPTISAKLCAADVTRDKIFIPTEAGIYVWDTETSRVKRWISEIPGTKILALDYSSAADSILAATERGVFVMKHPEVTMFLNQRIQDRGLSAEALMDHFREEPNVNALQDVAMRYAEVHPDKILAWRNAAARKAWLPSLNLGYDTSQDQNIDLDRGGTGDPDTFIEGPAENGKDVGLGLSWDLSELIWSTDQTTIDNRSKLMVQLRDDLLTQLNLLYFSRRRLQIEELLDASTDLETILERKMKIQEYTAGLDALTGGYFSAHLKPTLRIASEE